LIKYVLIKAIVEKFTQWIDTSAVDGAKLLRYWPHFGDYPAHYLCLGHRLLACRSIIALSPVFLLGGRVTGPFGQRWAPILSFSTLDEMPADRSSQTLR